MFIYDKEMNIMSIWNFKGLMIYEYERVGWIFYVKGFWCNLFGVEDGFSVFLVGSFNLGYRFCDRDLEV